MQDRPLELLLLQDAHALTISSSSDVRAVVAVTLSMALSQIARLAGLIATSASMIDNHLSSNNLPPPSFHEDGPVEFGMLTNHPEIEKARTTTIAACMELSDFLEGPLALLRPNVG